ncbi:MAG TPA: copper resistance CopC family protein [Actinomycetota bacterium]|jgi:methionine-rich copper-binding protein CopC
MNARVARGVLVLCAAAIHLGLHGAAWAAVRSQPAAGSVQTTVPERVTIAFPDPQARSARIEVTDPCGGRADAGATSVDGERVSIDIDGTASGRYIVRYAGVSSVDGSPTRGTFSFRVQGVEGCAAADRPREGREGRGIWDLPKADFAVALGIAALIGALGGLVYAAILGPKA